MNFKFSNITFYKRHNSELERYLEHKTSLHIINIKSKDKITEKATKNLYIDSEKENYEELINIDQKFEVVILTDVFEVTDDVISLLKHITSKLIPGGKLLLSSINQKYFLIIKILEKLSFKDVNMNFSYINNKKIAGIVTSQGFEYIKTSSKQIFPFKIFNFGNLLNTILESTLYFLNIGIKTYSLFRLEDIEGIIHSNTKTIIIPAKNEEGNLKNLVERIPKDEKYDLIIVCGVAQDNTLKVANEIMDSNKNFKIQVIEQSGKGKANAVWEAAKKANGEFVAILDSDLSVDPEELPNFFEIVDKRYADFVNGTRLVYEMEKGAMRYLNKIGNRIFQFFIGRVLKVPLTDTLCGTKVFRKKLLLNIFSWQEKHKTKDPFGDFDLLFSAAYYGEKILEYPIHYKTRVYGSTQISRFRDGYKLIIYLIKSYLIINTSKW